MRFVPVKSAEQLAVQAVHRIRSSLVADRVRLVNQVRGLLGEHGIVVAKDIGNPRRTLAKSSTTMRTALSIILSGVYGKAREELTNRMFGLLATTERSETHRINEIRRRLGKVEGIGPVTATALVAAVGDRGSFKNGRQFAAWLGLVPKQRSSGGRARLFGIMNVQTATATWRSTAPAPRLGGFETSRILRSLWLGKMRLRRHPKHCRCRARQQQRRWPALWSLLTSDSVYDPGLSVRAA